MFGAYMDRGQHAWLLCKAVTCVFLRGKMVWYKPGRNMIGVDCMCVVTVRMHSDGQSGQRNVA